ncbi:diadenylate cyclase CdaA [Acidaminobacterium chupaoyuni]
MDFFNKCWQYLRLVTVMDAIDMLIVAFIIYKVIKVIRNTNAERPLKGVILLLVATQLSAVLQLHVINYLLDYIMRMGLVALVILFQPELRKLLDQFGRSKLRLFKKNPARDLKATQLAIMRTVEAVGSMAWSKTGALIVFERSDNLEHITKTGSVVDAEVNAELLKNIFFNKAPLHDGAVVITDARIKAAGCLLPLSANLNISKELGTRHRAAVGMSENSDALCVVVSEETGSISLAMGGILKRHLAVETLERLLITELMPAAEPQQPQSIWERLRGKKQ